MKKAFLLIVNFSLALSLIAPSGVVFANETEVDGGSSPKIETIAEIEQRSEPVVLDGGVVISQVLVGNASQARLVEIYNNSDTAVDMTDWCVWYNASETKFDSGSKRKCVTTDDEAYRVILPARTHTTFIDQYLDGGLGTGAKGRVYLADKANKVIDLIAWDTVDGATNPFIVAKSGAHVFQRKMSSEAGYQDTDRSGDDLFLSERRQVYSVDGLVELADLCSNISGLQSEVPYGYERLSGGVCKAPEPVKFCTNLPDLTIEAALNEGYEIDQEGGCFKNQCVNLPGFHETPPQGFVVDDDSICQLRLLPLQVTELLPNPAGADEGGEFIEFYNPNDEELDLQWWKFYLNGDYQKSYSFPAEMKIGAKEYKAIKNSVVAYSLRNSSGSLRLSLVDGQHGFDVPEWVNAKDNRSWALVDGEWQYTAPSPGVNNPSLALVMALMPSKEGLPDCGEGRERNPLTGRCRNIPVANVLAPCKEGQYRSEETNRCRSIAVLVNALKPCADDQFRNPETNRCKKIASSDDLPDCGEGRERNPETNRCRNVLAAAMPSAPFAPEKVQSVASGTMGWWALGGASLLAVGYAGWQWRFEMGRLIKKVNERLLAVGRG